MNVTFGLTASSTEITLADEQKTETMNLVKKPGEESLLVLQMEQDLTMETMSE